jgi:hypothetical protein
MKCEYFYYSTKGGGKSPVVMNENGIFTIFDRNGKPLQKHTDNLLHSFGEDSVKKFLKRCTELNVHSLTELLDWQNQYEKLSFDISLAERNLYEAKKELYSFLYPIKTYLETKAMGCTDIVYWNYEPIENPKTRNEFFTPEDAKATLNSMKREYEEKYHDNLIEKERLQSEGINLHFPGEIDMESCYIWDAGDYLDDLIDQEEKGEL